MKRGTIQLLLGLITITLTASISQATVSHVTIDLSGTSVTNGQLDFSLYDNSDAIGDSYVLIDNVVLGSDAEYFDTDLGGFDDSWNPGAVVVENLKMRMDENLSSFVTTTTKDYLGFTATSLTFDLELFLSQDEGYYGFDEFVVTLYDLDNPNDEGYEVLWISADDSWHDDIVTLTNTVVPVPGAVGLCGLGLALLQRRRRS